MFGRSGSRASLLVVAGEASGDAMAAPVVRRLGVESFGLGGAALRDAGSELLSDVSRTAAMGVGAVVARAPIVVGAAARILSRARKLRPRAALLVGYSEFNAWLGPRLMRLGTRVLWYAPPQIWAWRAGRAPALARACDRMAVILPFEAELWRGHGADAVYVGHPALERSQPARAGVRDRTGMTPYADYVALLPGSRTHEVERHLGPMLAAANALRAERGSIDARVVIAPALPARCRAAISRSASAAGVGVIESDAASVLPAFDVALAASGTVTLECALAGVPPVIGWRAGRVTEALARRLVESELVGLPNVVLGERVFPELLGPAFTSEALTDEACRVLDERARWIARCQEVARRLREPLETEGTLEPPSERVAHMIEPWLA